MILNTRPEFYRERFHEAFSDIGLPILDSPALEIEDVGDALPSPNSFDALIFTSQIALSHFSHADDWRYKKVYVVGQGTAAAARAAGFSDIICTGENAKDMENYLRRTTFERGLYASAQDVATDLSNIFRDRIIRQITYRMAPVGTLTNSVVAKIKEGPNIIVPFFSKRSAGAFANLLRQAHLTLENTNLHAVGMSDDIFATTEGPWHSQYVVPHPTQAAMVSKVRDVAEEIGLISKAKE